VLQQNEESRHRAVPRFLTSGRHKPIADRRYGVGVAYVSSGVAIVIGVAIVVRVAILMGVAIVIGVAIGVAACIAVMSIVGSATTPQA